MRIGAAVHADEQDVDGAVVATTAQGRGADVIDPALEGPDLAPRDPGAHHDDSGQHSGHDADGCVDTGLRPGHVGRHRLRLMAS